MGASSSSSSADNDEEEDGDDGSRPSLAMPSRVAPTPEVTKRKGPKKSGVDDEDDATKLSQGVLAGRLPDHP